MTDDLPCSVLSPVLLAAHSPVLAHAVQQVRLPMPAHVPATCKQWRVRSSSLPSKNAPLLLPFGIALKRMFQATEPEQTATDTVRVAMDVNATTLGQSLVLPSRTAVSGDAQIWA